jgi:hypothetical protein
MATTNVVQIQTNAKTARKMPAPEWAALAISARAA